MIYLDIYQSKGHQHDNSPTDTSTGKSRRCIVTVRIEFDHVACRKNLTACGLWLTPAWATCWLGVFVKW